MLAALAAIALTWAMGPLGNSGFAGIWSTDWTGIPGSYNAGHSRMVITQSPTDPTELDGMWDGPGYNGLMTGHVNGGTWSGTWVVPGLSASGTFSLTLRASQFSGSWQIGNLHSSWTGTRIQ